MSQTHHSSNGAATDAAHDALLAALRAGEECLAAALAYRAAGWASLAVCPPDHCGVGKAHAQNCESPGKAPWGSWKEFQERLPTEEELRRKWRDNPQLNVGITLGPASGLIRVDVEGPLGEAELERVSGGDLPPTLEFTSGKEVGRGLLYRILRGVRLKTTSTPLEVGQELRLQGEGSQTVLPPSRHKSGRRYAWKPGHGPGEIEAAPAPGWLVELMRADVRGRKRAAGPPPDGEKVREGGRNTALASLAGSMRRRGMGRDAILAALRVENEQRCDPPLHDAEVEKVAVSISGYDPEPSADAFASRNGDGRGADEIACGPLALRPGRPRRTPAGKLAVPVGVWRGGEPIDQVDVTSAATSREAAARRLLEKSGNGLAVGDAARGVDAVIAWALARLDRPADAEREGDTLRAVLERYVREHYAPSRRDGRRVWLDGLGQYFDRPSFSHLLCEDMLAAARTAADVDDGEDRYALIAKVDAELRVIFGGLLAALPGRRPEDAPVHPDEREELAAAVVGMWSAVRSLTKTKTRDGEEKTHNTSLIEQAKAMVRDGKVPPGYWHKIHPAHAAFITIRERAEGGAVADAEILLAMNAELAASVGVKLPEGVNHFNLKKVGKKAGLFRDVGGLSDRAERGGTRVIVLSRDLTDYLLEDIDGKTVGEEKVSSGQGTVSAAGGGARPDPGVGDDGCGRDDAL
jgi:hypothetical protein